MIRHTRGQTWRHSGRLGAAIFLCAGVVLAGCKDKPYENTDYAGPAQSGGLSQKGSDAPVGERREFSQTAGAGVRSGSERINGFLWRAALDSVSFMPLGSVDSLGGVIITEWYAPPETPNERFKVTVLVRGQSLRSDGVKATVFRQRRDDFGSWIDAEVDNNTQIDLENIILSQARLLRNEAKNAPAE